jgi:UDP-glucuronate 4-epimerase
MVTGAAGFIGFLVARQLLANGREVVGADSVNGYYDPKLKEARIELLKRDPKFSFVSMI